MKILSALVLSTMVVAAPAAAQTDDWQDWPLGRKFEIAAEAYFPSLDTKIRVDATDGTPGTVIDFEQNLGMDDTETVPVVDFDWRFSKKHRLKVGYFSLNRSGAAVTVTEIRFGDTVFTADLPVSSFLDMDVVSLGYSYSLVFDEKKELAITGGFSIQDIQFGIVGNAGQGIIQATSGITAPLPAIGFSGGYAFTDKLSFRAGLGVFAFKFAVTSEDELRGEIVTATAGFYHQTFDNFRFGISYRLFDIDAAFGNTTGFNSIEYRYQGPGLGVTGSF